MNKAKIGFICPHCMSNKGSKVKRVSNIVYGQKFRNRQCLKCKETFRTKEEIVEFSEYDFNLLFRSTNNANEDGN